MAEPSSQKRVRDIVLFDIYVLAYSATAYIGVRLFASPSLFLFLQLACVCVAQAAWHKWRRGTGADQQRPPLERNVATAWSKAGLAASPAGVCVSIFWGRMSSTAVAALLCIIPLTTAAHRYSVWRERPSLRAVAGPLLLSGALFWSVPELARERAVVAAICAAFVLLSSFALQYLADVCLVQGQNEESTHSRVFFLFAPIAVALAVIALVDTSLGSILREQPAVESQGFQRLVYLDEQARHIALPLLLVCASSFFAYKSTVYFLESLRDRMVENVVFHAVVAGTAGSALCAFVSSATGGRRSFSMHVYVAGCALLQMYLVGLKEIVDIGCTVKYGAEKLREVAVHVQSSCTQCSQATKKLTWNAVGSRPRKLAFVAIFTLSAFAMLFINSHVYQHIQALGWSGTKSGFGWEHQLYVPGLRTVPLAAQSFRNKAEETTRSESRQRVDPGAMNYPLDEILDAWFAASLCRACDRSDRFPLGCKHIPSDRLVGLRADLAARRQISSAHLCHSINPARIGEEALCSQPTKLPECSKVRQSFFQRAASLGQPMWVRDPILLREMGPFLRSSVEDLLRRNPLWRSIGVDEDMSVLWYRQEDEFLPSLPANVAVKAFQSWKQDAKRILLLPSVWFRNSATPDEMRNGARRFLDVVGNITELFPNAEIHMLEDRTVDAAFVAMVRARVLFSTFGALGAVAAAVSRGIRANPNCADFNFPGAPSKPVTSTFPSDWTLYTYKGGIAPRTLAPGWIDYRLGNALDKWFTQPICSGATGLHCAADPGIGNHVMYVGKESSKAEDLLVMK